MRLPEERKKRVASMHPTLIRVNLSRLKVLANTSRRSGYKARQDAGPVYRGILMIVGLKCPSIPKRSGICRDLGTFSRGREWREGRLQRILMRLDHASPYLSCPIANRTCYVVATSEICWRRPLCANFNNR